jgi:hypothetical protein
MGKPTKIALINSAKIERATLYENKENVFLKVLPNMEKVKWDSHLKSN